MLDRLNGRAIERVDDVSGAQTGADRVELSGLTDNNHPGGNAAQGAASLLVVASLAVWALDFATAQDKPGTGSSKILVLHGTLGIHEKVYMSQMHLPF